MTKLLSCWYRLRDRRLPLAGIIAELCPVVGRHKLGAHGCHTRLGRTRFSQSSMMLANTRINHNGAGALIMTRRVQRRARDVKGGYGWRVGRGEGSQEWCHAPDGTEKISFDPAMSLCSNADIRRQDGKWTWPQV